MTKDSETATEETTTTRRSSRIASQAKPLSAGAPKERKPRGKKRTTEEGAGEEVPGDAPEDGETPVLKKAKPASKAATKPPSKSAKPASKAESKSEKPESKKPASKSKPASKGKPASKAKPPSKSNDEGEISSGPAPAPDTIMEEPEEKSDAEGATKFVEAEAPAPEAPAVDENATEAAEPAKAPEPAEEAQPAQEAECAKDVEPAKDVESEKETEPANATDTAAESLVETPSSSKELKIGDLLPNITLPNYTGENIDVGSLANEKGVVFFLVPKANTPGCTTQALAYRDAYQDFTGLDYAIYCVSADSTKVQSSWQSKHTLPYPLLSDSKRTLISLLGAASGTSTKRSHFIFEKGTGKLVDRQIGIKPGDSSKVALEFLKKHAAPS